MAARFTGLPVRYIQILQTVGGNLQESVCPRPPKNTLPNQARKTTNTDSKEPPCHNVTGTIAR